MLHRNARLAVALLAAAAIAACLEDDHAPAVGAGDPALVGPGEGGALIASLQARILPPGAAARLDGLAVDDAGDAVVIGSFERFAVLGNDLLVSAGERDVLLARTDAAGAVVWARRFGDALADLGVDVAVTPAGEIHAVGTFQRDLDFGASVALAKRGVTPTADVFIARLDPGGAGVWARQIFLIDVGILGVSGVAADPDGNVLVTGPIEGIAQIEDTVISSPPLQNYLVKLDPVGAVQWLDLFPGPDLEVMGIVADHLGNVAIFGEDVRGIDTRLLKWDPAGVRVVDRVYEGTDRQAEIARDLAVASDGDLLVTAAGRFGTPPGPDGEFDHRELIARLDPTGEPIWIRRLDGEVADHVAADGPGRVVIAGRAGLGEPAPPVGASQRIFVASLDGADGARRWTRAVVGDAAFTALDVNPAGAPTLAGHFEGILPLGDRALVSPARRDLFLLLLAP